MAQQRIPLRPPPRKHLLRILDVPPQTRDIIEHALGHHLPRRRRIHQVDNVHKCALQRLP